MERVTGRVSKINLMEMQMIRTLLASTAIGALTIGGALAQEQMQQNQHTMGQEVFLEDGMTLILPSVADGQMLTLYIRSDAGQQAAGQVGTQMQADQTVAQQAQPGANQGAMQPEREGMQQGDPSMISAEELTNANVYGINDDNIGNVNDIIITADGEIDAILVDVGGFLGIGARQVAIGLDNLELMVDGNNNWHVYTPFTREQLEAQPEYDQQTWEQQRDQQRLTF